MLDRFLFKQIDNSALIVFRIIFGLLCFLESVGAIFTGWIKRTLIDPQFTFNFIGFDFLQPLPGNWMYVYYAVMGFFGILIMVGYKYRISMISFTIMWSCTYLMQKSSYNNHYYLLMLLSAIMVFLPANRYASIDAKNNPNIKEIAMPSWVKWVFVLQLFILYTYASIAKIYPDWIDLTVPKLLMANKANYPIIGDLLQHKFIVVLIAYGGILYDGLVIPLLLYKPTRKYIFLISIFFHLFNSIVFQVGIFPYLALAFSLFFFEPEKIKNLFLKKKPLYTKNEVITKNYKPILVAVGVVYFTIQIALPLRQHFIKDNVLWTEEGHRLSWRMMLRSKSGRTSYKVVDKASNTTEVINMSDYLTKKQIRTASCKPDVIWQFAQHLKKTYAKKGKDVKVFVDAKISVNGRPYQRLIDKNTDLASVPWYWAKHNDWILPSQLDK
ncbi:Vitamin K-dependent gamma-carboxylase [Mesoflavibacter sp. HG96]|uniref:HTTM domain-containing protein n=1 Tax=Mesoflavibacter profundi TaxID=2708110 RepID=A0ABT4S2G4_9FLAO|nr:MULTISPECIES: HTTM domain-containing protein [Mesoflavibacter]MDA0178190.1 HTTM domain-containing protein [Mesoflavibacter profundi]QIJ89152.1 Vitamin K-dependent gamma-carboxylase [Mesoflavibacter sp. HG96]QIJ91880.1 Vitamin K-dependent gamma-carboxylase [Mesoflavibacter sp. HG37]